MKKYIFLGMMILCWGCEQNDIAVYQEDIRMDFPYTTASCDFSDQDYLTQVVEKETEIEVRLVGYKLESPLNYVLKGTYEDEVVFRAEARIEPFYVMPADTVNSKAKIYVKRPELLNTEYSLDLVFDMENPVQQFQPGRTENRQCRLRVTYRLKPSSWNTYFGVYSNNKYQFMMDEFGTTYENIPQTDESKDRVREAYADYRKTHGPLLDDENPREEIVFPE